MKSFNYIEETSFEELERIAGDKSIDETVKLIQSEANIYINEQR